AVMKLGGGGYTGHGQSQRGNVRGEGEFELIVGGLGTRQSNVGHGDGNGRADVLRAKDGGGAIGRQGDVIGTEDALQGGAADGQRGGGRAVVDLVVDDDPGHGQVGRRNVGGQAGGLSQGVVTRLVTSQGQVGYCNGETITHMHGSEGGARAA